MSRANAAAEAANPNIVARPDRTIVLVGMMGVGKTTIGKRLAQRLGMDFIDADAEIEKAAGYTIPEIFEKFGEAQFRDGERRVIARLLKDEPAHVLAAGGGAFNDPETRERIAERGISVWLRAELDVLAKRVARRNNRPLLADGDVEQKLAALMEERAPVYALAELHLDTSEGEPEDSVDALVQKLEEGGYMKVYACRP
jgi:shikimate kinase